jgi:glutathione S-transferase
LGHVLLTLEGRAVLAVLPRCAAAAASEFDRSGPAQGTRIQFSRYYFQGIGRYAPAAAYARGLADLQVLANLIPANDYLHGPKPTSIDAAVYGFIANIHFFYEIDTPLKQFVASHPNLVRHCTEIHAAIGSTSPM